MIQEDFYSSFILSILNYFYSFFQTVIRPITYDTIVKLMLSQKQEKRDNIFCRNLRYNKVFE